ncbi:MAG: 1,4-alpha-glucan branching protein GlgB [Peptoanaerobacter stomatis]
MDFQQFFEGSCFDAYKYFGAHIQDDGVVFRVYAPNARKVTLIGEFSSWNEIHMDRGYHNVHSVFVENAKVGMMYKYRIYTDEHNFVEHCDPYGFSMELRPNFASIIADLDEYEFSDEDWMKNRTKSYDEPLNIYELHLGSWIENKDDVNGWYKYEELSDLLIKYLEDNHYNAVEFMPLTEHPADISWGYQSTGFFAPTSRYGTPYGLQKLIDKLHKAKIKVIMDFVPVHFAIDDYALVRFDGTPLYEYPDNSMGLSEWGSYNFIHSKGEVSSFLKSSANYWLDKYHFDGLRMDAISRIIYWQGNSDRGINQKGLEFMKTLNSGLDERHKNVILIAEDSSDFPKVTAPVSDGGLGFTYKWDMGWMNDTLDFFKKTPKERKGNYNKITFSMMYFYSECFLLAISHDENVHGKATILQKMYGNYEDKFPQARAFYAYMFTHPGKKLNFMGNEIGHLREWDETKELDYFLLKYPIHDAFNKYIKRLQNIYMNSPALYDKDYMPESFKWLIVDDKQGVTYSYVRKSEVQKIVCVFNFSDEYHKNYEYKHNKKVRLKEILNSDWDIYGGKTKYQDENIIDSICVRKQEIFTAYEEDFTTLKEIDAPKEVISEIENISYEHYIKMDLPPYSARLFEVVIIG